MQLRDYQSDLIEKARDGFRRGLRRQLMVAPTGAGKTILSAHMQGAAARRGSRTWFCVHRKEIVEQTAVKFRAVGIPFGVVMAGYPMNPDAMVQLCSVQSLARRVDKLPAPDGIVWDEAHHMAAGTHSRIASQFPKAWHMGVTATPERLDGRGLGEHFDNLIEGPTIRWLMNEGHLCDYRYFAPGKPDLHGVRTTHGDYNRADLGDAMAKPKLVGAAVEHYCRMASGKSAICFEASLASSRETVAAFRSNGVEALHIDGDMHADARREAFEAFRSGEVKVLSNVDIAGEGVDVPGIEVVIHRRPTRSLTFYLQANGRAFRPSDGKAFALILDHAGNAFTHGLPDEERKWSLEGRKRKGSGGAGPDDSFPIKTCMVCYRVSSAAARCCPGCGNEFGVVGRDYETTEGVLEELKRIDREAAEKERKDKRRRQLAEEYACRSLADMQAIAKARGYQPGWAWQRWNHVKSKRGSKAA